MMEQSPCSTSMNIKVKISGGKVVVLEGLTGSEQVGDLVIKVAAQVGVQGEEWTWVKDRVELSSSGSIIQCGLMNGDIVRMITQETLRKRRLRRRNGTRVGRSASVSSTSEENSPKHLQIRIKSSTSKVLRINANSSDTMNTLLKKVKVKWTLTSSESCLAILKRDDAPQLVTIPANDTVEDRRLTSKSLLVLVSSSKSVPPYPAALTEVFEEISLPPHPGNVDKERGVKIRLLDGKTIRLRNMTFSKHTASCLFEVLKMKTGHPHYNEQLAYLGVPLKSTATLEANGVPFNETISLQSTEPESPEMERLPSVLLSRTTSSSPLCQFTLCSLSPIFGPIIPPTVSLPAC